MEQRSYSSGLYRRKSLPSTEKRSQAMAGYWCNNDNSSRLVMRYWIANGIFHRGIFHRRSKLIHPIKPNFFLTAHSQLFQAASDFRTASDSLCIDCTAVSKLTLDVTYGMQFALWLEDATDVTFSQCSVVHTADRHWKSVSCSAMLICSFCHLLQYSGLSENTVIWK